MRALTSAIVLLACLGIAAPAVAQQQTPTTPRQGQTAPRSTAPAARSATGQFRTEAEAQQHCPSDNVVWANPKSKVYHFAGTRNFGKTKEGAYMCQKESDSSGFRAAKNEKPPSKSP